MLLRSHRREIGRRLRVYEFELDWDHEKVLMIFSSVAGHIKALDFHENYRSWNSCDQVNKVYSTSLECFSTVSSSLS